MDENKLCQYLKWDSDFFGSRIAKINSSRLTTETLKDVLLWSEDNNIDCLYFLADSTDMMTMRLAAQSHFDFVDIRVTYSKQLNNDVTPEMSKGIRPSMSSDVPALRAIARMSHRDSRFYADPAFSEESCDALYATWIEKSCNGYADTVLVAEMDGRAVGYISCHLRPAYKGEIGLVGVQADMRGSGWGHKLVEAALHWFDEREVKVVTVVTQGRNIGAQRLYQRKGFLIESVGIWYHRWFKMSRP